MCCSKKSGSNLDKSTWVTCLSRHRGTAHQGSQSCWPNLKYVMMDSWSGLGGQFTTVLPLLFLASTTSRIAIIPSFNDEHHYKADVIIKMSMLYDLERFRQIVSASPSFTNQSCQSGDQEDDVGCYVSNFVRPRSFLRPPQHPPDDHSNRQAGSRRQRSTDLILRCNYSWADWTYESYAMFDTDFERRMEKIALQTQDGDQDELLDVLHQPLDLKRAGQDEVSKEQQKLMAPQWKEFNRKPEWHYVGRYLDFAPKIWEIALASVRASLGVTTIPQELITMHIRRGDFLTWCEKGTDCTPSLDAFAAAVKDLEAELKMSSPELDVDKIQVLITTDEQDDRAILDQIAANGWVISQTSSSMIEEAFGDAWKWADSAIAQAILSLGARGFVGTSNSQVSQLTQLRIQSYYKRKQAPTRRSTGPESS
ncbi:BQ5605_C003g02338 [Microbotryum silenes-dioicae]|uniref:BQ5605_C003g02338 protein n=1 Tax=Microbotryum silenes-dioicae TaxID=796604 RepID=A0A2X0M1A5_9BASI|nr:BQ5605_C003g02338 [Microbotryum silenes-dioicae]